MALCFIHKLKLSQLVYDMFVSSFTQSSTKNGSSFMTFRFPYLVSSQIQLWLYWEKNERERELKKLSQTAVNSFGHAMFVNAILKFLQQNSCESLQWHNLYSPQPIFRFETKTLSKIKKLFLLDNQNDTKWRKYYEISKLETT